MKNSTTTDCYDLVSVNNKKHIVTCSSRFPLTAFSSITLLSKCSLILPPSTSFQKKIWLVILFRWNIYLRITIICFDIFQVIVLYILYQNWHIFSPSHSILKEHQPFYLINIVVTRYFFNFKYFSKFSSKSIFFLVIFFHRKF